MNMRVSEIVSSKIGNAIANVQTWGGILINVKAYGAQGDGLTDDTAAISAAIDEAITSKGKVYFPPGTYAINSGIVKDLNGVEIEIEGTVHGEVQAETRILWRGGAGTLFTFTDGRTIRFRNIEISGYLPGTDTDVLTAGSIGISAAASIDMENCSFTGFENLVVWNGGFYHKFTNCFLGYATLAFKDFNANNLIFDRCKVDIIEQLLTVNAGLGPVVFTNGSIERFTGTVFTASSGATPGIAITNSYIENYPSLTPPSGISGDYTDSFFISGFGNTTVMHNSIMLDGIRRFVFGNTLFKSVISIGNTIHYKGSTSSTEYYIADVSNALETAICNDLAYDVLTYVGSYTPTYFYSPTRESLIPNASKVYDAFLKEEVTLLPPWNGVTLLNSWAQNATAGNNTISYRVINNTIHLKGIIDGSAATANAMFNVPYTTTKTIWSSTGANGSTSNFILRLLTNGDIRCETTGTNAIILDGVTFDIV